MLVQPTLTESSHCLLKDLKDCTKLSLQSVQILKHLHNNVVRVLKHQSQQQLHHIMQILLLHRVRERYKLEDKNM